MVTATVTTKGQVTIPKAVRESLRLHSGDRIAFIIHGDSEVTLKPITKSVDEVFGKLRNSTQPPLTVEEIKKAVAKRIRSRSR